MNKLVKIIYAVLGGVNMAFNLVLPILFSLLLIDNVYLTQQNQIIILIVGFLASTYRSLSLWVE